MRTEFDQGRRIKWGYATHILEDTPAVEGQLTARLGESDGPPRPNDVIVAEVLALAYHSKIELACGRRSKLFPGDLVGAAYGYRYATRRWEGTIPAGPEPCHLLSVAGVCGEVLGRVDDMEPTTLRPLGYLTDRRGVRVNLADHGLRPTLAAPAQPTTILIVGSAMDSGKTTAASSVIHGLMRSGARVCAAKLTGTASSKDIRLMEDAGAIRVLDFTDIGHSSTATCSREQLWDIVVAAASHLSAHQPDYLVLEIADGLVQRETAMLLEELHAHQYIDYTIYTCNDTLGVQSGVEKLRQYDLNVAAVSGWVACSPLAAQEAQPHTDLPVFRADELSDPGIAEVFTKRLRQVSRRRAVG